MNHLQKAFLLLAMGTASAGAAPLEIYDVLLGDLTDRPEQSQAMVQDQCKLWLDRLASLPKPAIVYKNCGSAKTTNLKGYTTVHHSGSPLDGIPDWDEEVYVSFGYVSASQAYLRLEMAETLSTFKEKIFGLRPPAYRKACADYKQSVAQQLGDKLFYVSCAGKDEEALKGSLSEGFSSVATVYLK